MIKIAICGWGNLGKAVADDVAAFPDLRLCAVFSRRPHSVTPPEGVPVYDAADIEAHAREIDVLILASGSATDLPKQTPGFAKHCNVIDSFDTHAAIPAHFAAVDAAAKESGHLCLISAGWDPGLFSLCRAYFGAFVPQGETYTFWGKGVSQGHSDAVRRVPGVRRGVQYTVPIDEAVEQVRSGECPALSARQKHRRECFVVAEEGADRAAIEREIKCMPNYFADYDTTVRFISEEEFDRDHTAMPHGGFVLRSGKHTPSFGSLLEFDLKLSSNPHFTASVLLAYARAVARMHSDGKRGCMTVFDVPPAALCADTPEQMRARLL